MYYTLVSYCIFNTSTLYQQIKQPPLFKISKCKKITPYGYGNPDPGLGQTQKCGG